MPSLALADFIPIPLPCRVSFVVKIGKASMIFWITDASGVLFALGAASNAKLVFKNVL
jgi:hypothetical protein